MKNFLGGVSRIVFVIMLVAGALFSPQYSVLAAPILTLNPITWNVIGLDSNNVNVGPNNFPVGIRVCNTGDQPATNVTATFVWDSTNANINLRAGSLNPITFASLPNGTCSDFYFEVVITRTSAAYDTARQYHINVTADGLGTISTPTPREIYVEHLVSQNRNSVLDVRLDGVPIATGGTMNLIVGNTYTITLVSDTATNGYEQLETFINFPNTIFQILNVATTYTADGGTDPDAATKLYADGCGWDDATRTCTGTGKYGGVVTVIYTVRIISGGGTSQPLNTLIYDFSGSSYHYNSDFDVSTRIVNISDPASCVQQTITQWTFNDTILPSTGSGTLTSAGVSGPSYGNPGGNTTNPAVAYTAWDNAGSSAEYLQFAVSTVGYYAVHFSFGGARATNQAPTTATVLYSSNGTTFTAASPNVTLPDSGTWTNFPAFDLSSVNALNGNSNTAFRIYASGSSGGTNNRTAYFDNVTVTGCALPAAINISKGGVINQTIVSPTDVTNVGDRIDYQIVITNTGGVPLTSIILTDNRIDPASLICNPPLAGLTLLPGQSTTCTGYHTLTLADFDTGFVTNTATADSDQVGPVSDSTTQELPQTPALTLDKTASTQIYTAVGQQVTYTYTLTNTGNVTLTAPYIVTDDKVTVDCSGATSPLLPGQSTTCTATYAITADDIPSGLVTNVATANATFENTTVPSNQDSVTINYAGLNIIKEVSTDNVNWNDTSVNVNVGDTVYYRIRVQNSGTVTLTGFTVDDGMAGCTLTRDADDPGNDDANFEGGETWVYTCSVTAIAGTQNNTATADSTETGPDTDSASYFGNAPALNVVKEVGTSSTGPWNDTSITVAVGADVYYRITVTNTGNIALTGITVNDPNVDTSGCTWTDPLGVGASTSCVVGPVTAIAGTNNNTASADSNETGPDTDSATYFGNAPALNVVKEVGTSSTGPWNDTSITVAVGADVYYRITVTNTGNIALTGITVNDPNVDTSGCTWTDPLGVGASTSCVVGPVTAVAGTNNNTASADSNETGPDTDSASYFGNAPALNVVKTQTSTGPYILGDTITYSIVVTNTGNVTLTNVTVSDDSAVLGDCDPVQPAILEPGASMTCSANHEVTEADLENRSYVNTATADSEQTPPSDSTVTVNFDVADLSLAKTVTNTTPDVSTNINFIVTVTNGGPEDATGVEVVERLPNGFTFISATTSKGTYNSATAIWQIGDLALNESVSLNMTVRVNDSGSYTNTAEISAARIIDPDSTPNNQDPNEDDQSSVTVRPQSDDDDDDNPPPPPPPSPPPPAIGGFGFLIPVTGFAPNVVTDVSHEPYTAYSDTSITLDIPALSVKIPIVGVPKKDGTWNVSWLANQAGWLEGSAFPSWNGNSVLTSHVYLPNGKPGPFAKLHELKTGDQVIVRAFGQKYIFEVLTNAIVSPTDKSVMRHEEKPWLTLVTCADYDFKTGTYKNRFIVRAVLVKVSADK